jgi:hypothetical protein
MGYRDFGGLAGRGMVQKRPFCKIVREISFLANVVKWCSDATHTTDKITPAA